MNSILQFPPTGVARSKSLLQQSIRRSETLPHFRETTSFRKVTDIRRAMIDEAFGLTWTAPLIIEFQDPKVVGKRDIHLRLLWHRDHTWKVKWMDRTVTPGFKRYGLFPL